MVEVNAIEIEQVIVNLVRTAIEASPSGERIEVRLTSDGAEARVEDHGRMEFDSGEGEGTRVSFMLGLAGA
jgi:signal transduction histidine kinase